MSAVTHNIIYAEDLHDLILQAIQQICCNIGVDVDNTNYGSKLVKSFNITKVRKLDSSRAPSILDPHHGGGRHDREKSTNYADLAGVSATAKFQQNAITVPSQTSLVNVKTIVDKFFANTIKPILYHNVITANQYYHINECIKRFIDDTIICCISPFYSLVRFYFDGDTSNEYRYSITPIIPSTYGDDKISLFYSKFNLDLINLAFMKTTNCRICTYTTSIE